MLKEQQHLGCGLLQSLTQQQMLLVFHHQLPHTVCVSNRSHGCHAIPWALAYSVLTPSHNNKEGKPSLCGWATHILLSSELLWDSGALQGAHPQDEQEHQSSFMNCMVESGCGRLAALPVGSKAGTRWRNMATASFLSPLGSVIHVSVHWAGCQASACLDELCVIPLYSSVCSREKNPSVLS